MQEINIAFTPYESQVFTLEDDETFNIMYNPQRQGQLTAQMEMIAEQVGGLRYSCKVVTVDRDGMRYIGRVSGGEIQE